MTWNKYSFYSNRPKMIKGAAAHGNTPTSELFVRRLLFFCMLFIVLIGYSVNTTTLLPEHSIKILNIVSNNNTYRHNHKSNHTDALWHHYLKKIHISMPFVMKPPPRNHQNPKDKYNASKQCQFIIQNIRGIRKFTEHIFIKQVDIVVNGLVSETNAVTACLANVDGSLSDNNNTLRTRFSKPKDHRFITYAHLGLWKQMLHTGGTNLPTLFVYLEHDHLLTYSFIESWAKDTALLQRHGYVKRGFHRSCVQYEMCDGNEHLIAQTGNPVNIAADYFDSFPLSNYKPSQNIIRIKAEKGDTDDHFFVGLDHPYCAAMFATPSRLRSWLNTAFIPQQIKKTKFLGVQEWVANSYIYTDIQVNDKWRLPHRSLVPVYRSGFLGAKIHHMPDKYCHIPHVKFGKRREPFFHVAY